MPTRIPVLLVTQRKSTHANCIKLPVYTDILYFLCENYYIIHALFTSCFEMFLMKCEIDIGRYKCILFSFIFSMQKQKKLNKNKKIVKRKKNRMKLAKTWFDVEKRKCNSQMTSMSPRSTLCFFLTCFDLNEEIPSWHIDIGDSMFLSKYTFLYL